MSQRHIQHMGPGALHTASRPHMLDSSSPVRSVHITLSAYSGGDGWGKDYWQAFETEEGAALVDLQRL